MPKTKKRNQRRKKSPATALRLAAAVSERVEIENVRMLASNCRRVSAVAGKALDSHLSHTVETQVNRKAGLIAVFPSFRMEARLAGEKGDEPVLFVEAVFALVYRLASAKGLTKRNFEQFGKINGIYNAWPYWREFLQNTIARMGLPPLVAPVYRISEAANGPSQENSKKL